MNVFTYGTLMDQEIMNRVAGARYRCAEATLNDFIRKTVRGEVYPGIVRRNGHVVPGIVYFDVPSSAVTRLDAFEGPLYERKELVVIDGEGRRLRAQAYAIATHHGDRVTEEEWDFDEFLRRHKADFQSGYPGYQDLV